MPEKTEEVLPAMDDGSNTDDEYLSWKESTVENTDTPQTVNSSQEEQSYEANEDTETGGGEPKWTNSAERKFYTRGNWKNCFFSK